MVPLQMSLSRTRTAQYSNASLDSKVVAFAKAAWNNFDSNTETDADWCRKTARAFYHTLSTPVPFGSLYAKFMQYAESNCEASSSHVQTTFAEDGKCTDAEYNKGRSQLHALLHHEYSSWWDAFEAEAEEDFSEDALSAEDRFANHCAKKLSSKTGVSRKDAAIVVKAWVHEMNA